MEARWQVALSLGLRQGEALGLWWSDLDPDKSELRIVRQLARPREPGAQLTFTSLKTARATRVLRLPAPLVASLDRHRHRQTAEQAVNPDWSDHRLMFATAWAPIDPRNDVRAFKAILAEAGLRDVRLHDLRHTAASLLLAQSIHPRVVMELLGHSQIGLTMNTYSHVMPSLMSEAADSMAGTLWAAHLHEGTENADQV